jgi:alpha,alpha-trehalase
MYRHLRAAAESGWDFSSRWLSNPSNLGSIQTTDIIPIDLNCLIYHLETLIAEAATISGDHAKVMEYEQRANNRKTALLKLCWNEEKGFFEDYNFKKRDFTGILSLAGAYPLFFNMVNDNQAQRVTEVLGSKFLKPGGFVTTLEETGQQWDAPNGWAPLQWMTIKGLLNYQQLELAMEAIDRWLAINNRVYKQTGKMVEKYNVNDISLLAGGGEYPVQDGFGWSNGVALELLYVQSEVEEELLEAQEDTN